MAWNPSPEVAAVRDAARKLGAGRAVLCPEIWTGCYREPWRKGHDLVPDAFKHPAKASKSLLMRIVKTGLERGWWRAGDTVADPFGGIGTTGIVGAYSGLAVVCCELEPAFVDLCRANFALHRAKWEALGVPQPVVIQGDSRRLRAVLAGADGCISSPPYAESVDGDRKRSDEPSWANRPAEFKTPGRGAIHDGYGKTLGQVGALREGDFAAALGSPPYVESVHDGNRIDPAKLTGNPAGPNSQAFAQGYGSAPGQIGRMAEGEFQGCVSSPPYAKSMDTIEDADARAARTDGFECGQKNLRYGQNPHTFLSRDPSGLDNAARRKVADENPQLGQVREETYWQAVAAIYAEVFALLRPGGHIALICKDYVRDKQRQPLCDRTWALLQHVGFLPVTRVYAMLGRKWKEEMLSGETVEREKSRKSFFRRLAERKGSPRIDWEEVLVMQKPATAGGSSCPGETWCRRNGHDDRPG